jgi:hypothetical protein
MTDISFSNKSDYISYQYLINNDRMKKIGEQSHADQSLSLKDKKFYRKRFYNLTKELYKNQINNPSLERIFNNYLDESIKYFQFLDLSDSLQEEYNNLNITNGEMGKSNFNYNIVKDNDIIARKTHSRNSLDNFVIKKNIKKKINIFPEKKVVNLYDKKLKKKGIKKKKKIVK